MRPRPDVAVRAVSREADRVRDAAGENLIRPQQQRRDGQPGGVGGRVAVGPHVVGGEVPDGARPGRRGLAVREVLQVVELVQLAEVLVDDKRVAVAAARGARPALDQRVLVDRITLSRMVAFRLVTKGGRDAVARRRRFALPNEGATASPGGAPRTSRRSSSPEAKASRRAPRRSRARWRVPARSRPAGW